MASVEELEASRDEIQRMVNEALAHRHALKERIGYAKSQALQGRYMPAAEFRALEAAYNEAGRRHQELMVQLGFASRRVKAARGREWSGGTDAARAAQSAKDIEASMPFHRAFTLIAKTMLPPETYAVIADAAQATVENQAKATQLTGQVLPALATVGGPKRRKTETP